jgi:hypothetical protein
MAKASPESASTSSRGEDQVNRARKGRIDGKSEGGTAILAIAPHGESRSDKVASLAKDSAEGHGAKTSRRGFIMNTIVSTAAIATATAIPNQSEAFTKAHLQTAVEALDPKLIPAALVYLDNQDETAKRAACLSRTETVIDLLRTRYIREGWTIDEDAAERTLAYSRAYAADGSDPDDEREAAMDFFHSHGVSLDWVFGGDIAGLICGAAKNSPRATSIADAQLIALADRYIAAERIYSDLTSKVDQMEGTFRYQNDRPIPATLFWQESDEKLGLPSPHSLYIRGQLGTLEDHPAAFETETDIARLQAEKWVTSTRSEGDGGWKLSSEYDEPTPAARARAAEIIAAFVEWQTTAKRPPLGYKKALRERDQAERAYMKIEKEIAKMRAQTFQGMFAKLRCAHHYTRTKRIDGIEGGSCAEVMALSMFNDLKRWSGESQTV